jgi:uncharacterized repeat protein (TIGR03803 family)
MLKSAVVLSLAVLLLSAGGAHASSFTVLKTFCQLTACKDGGVADAPLVIDGQGNLFGVTVTGGRHNRGMMFELQNTSGGYVFRRGYDFCVQTGCNDGWFPYSGLILDTSGNLYGTTSRGGAYGGGIAFKLLPAAKPGDVWKFVKLHDFCIKAGCADGKTPMSGLTYQGAASGAPYDGTSPLFGTTTLGGAKGNGAAYRLQFAAGRGKPKEAVIYSFCAQTNCADGLTPQAPLTIDGNGNIYGTTNYGGAFGASDDGGVVFELSPTRNAYTYTVLHSFCAQTQCADGDLPGTGALALDGGGTLYGTAGRPGGGQIYALSPDGANSAISTVYSFCYGSGCLGGFAPDGPLIIDANGDIFGTAADGGSAADPAGVVFMIHDGAETVLHSFCSNCTDGANPLAVVMDGSGNLFGTTWISTVVPGGTAFEISP